MESKKQKMKVRYVGPTFGAVSLTNGKVYRCLGIERDSRNGPTCLRIVDDSREDYLYSANAPGPLWDPTITGKWEIVEDDENKTLETYFSNPDTDDYNGNFAASFADDISQT